MPQLESKNPVAVAKKITPLICAGCKKIIATLNMALFAEVWDSKTDKIVAVYAAHKGSCDNVLEDELPEGQTTNWEEMSAAVIPARFVRTVMTTLNRMKDEPQLYTEQGFDDWKRMLLILSQYVCRETTPDERAVLEHLDDFGL